MPMILALVPLRSCARRCPSVLYSRISSAYIASTAPRCSARRLDLTPQHVENTNVGHSRFLAEASHKDRWKDKQGEDTHNPGKVTSDDGDIIQEGKGKLSPTASHLFKLIIPLHSIKQDHTHVSKQTSPPIVFLLHPSQPLSHVARLLSSTLASKPAAITFRSTTPSGRAIRWSDSTDVANFIRDAARTREFVVCIADSPNEEPYAQIPVEVPSFASRTRFLRRRLATVEVQLERMEELKRACDSEAHRGARKMALGGFGILVVYWGAVARLTFWDYGWDVMEPITYLSGLSMVVLSYLWFLYQGREVSYSSVLHYSVSARRDALYKARGLDIDHWMDLVAEGKGIRKEISRIAEDYDESRWKEGENASAAANSS